MDYRMDEQSLFRRPKEKILTKKEKTRERADHITSLLESYRLREGIPLLKLAGLLNVSYSTLYRWLYEGVKPSRIHDYRISKLLRLPTQVLTSKAHTQTETNAISEATSEPEQKL